MRCWLLLRRAFYAAPFRPALRTKAILRPRGSLSLWIGKNRVSLSLTLVGRGNNLFVSGITSGGSQAVFFKINTFGENAFLQKLEQIVEHFV
jgi:hypothetical protein